MSYSRSTYISALLAAIIFVVVIFFLITYLVIEHKKCIERKREYGASWSKDLESDVKKIGSFQRSLAAFVSASKFVERAEFDLYVTSSMVDGFESWWVGLIQPDSGLNKLSIKYTHGRYAGLWEDVVYLRNNLSECFRKSFSDREVEPCYSLVTKDFLRGSGGLALLVAAPVLDSQDHSIKALVVGAYSLNGHLKKKLDDLHPEMYTHLYQGTPSNAKYLLGFSSHDEQRTLPVLDISKAKTDSSYYLYNLDTPGIPITAAFSKANHHNLTSHFDGVAFSLLVVSFLGPLLVYMVSISLMRRRTDMARAKDHANHAQKLIDGSMDALVEIDSKGKILTWNRAAEKIFGWSLSEVKGKSLSTYIIPPEYRGAHEAGLNRHQLTGKSQMLGKMHEFRALRKSGNYCDVEMFVEKILIEGRLIFYSFIRDISERKQRQSQQESLLQNIPDAAWFKDTSGKFLAVNDAFCNACGWGSEELLGKTDFDIWPNELAKSYVEDDHRVLESGAGYEITEPLVMKTGEKRWISTAKRPVSDSEGRLIGTVGIARDITEILEDQEKLQALMSEQDAIFNAALIGIFFTKPDSRGIESIHRYNDRAQELFSYETDELSFSPLEILFTNKKDYRDLVNCSQIGSSRQGVVREVVLKKKNDVLFWGRVTSRPLDISNPFRGNVWLVADISNERQAQEQLMRSQRMEVIGQLTGGLAHDFNNLLGVIIANLDLALEYTGEADDSKKYIGLAVEASLRGSGLTKKLMAIARKQAFSPVSVDINKSLLDMRGILQSTVGANVLLELHLQPDPAVAYLDASGFETAILNLVINSRDALTDNPSLDDAIKISTNTIRFDESDSFFHGLDPGLYICVSVSDNGPGMSRDVLDSAMEAFFTTKPIGSGTGLGLNMVQAFVDQSKGNVKIYSEESYGTTVTMILPLEEYTEIVVTNDSPKRHIEASGRILLVEDEASLLLATSAWLKSLGYEVVTADNGESAFTVFKASSGDFDLVLTDVVMPGAIDGIQLSEEIKRQDPDANIIYMSGFTGLVSSETRFTRKNLLQKPFRKKDLIEIIQKNIRYPE